MCPMGCPKQAVPAVLPCMQGWWDRVCVHVHQVLCMHKGAILLAPCHRVEPPMLGKGVPPPL